MNHGGSLRFGTLMPGHRVSPEQPWLEETDRRQV